jgi:hypothetical protein
MTEELERGQEISWRKVVASCSLDTRRIARMWLYYTLFYWLAPTCIVVAGLFIGKQSVKLVDLIIHGQFLIYAITLTAGSTRLITRDVPKSGPFVNRQGFNLWAQIMIFPALAVYGLLGYFGTAPSQNGINTPFVATYSIVLLAGAFCFSYVVFLIDAQRTAQLQGDVQKRASEAIEHSPDRLKQQFDKLQGQESTAQPATPNVEGPVMEVDIAEAVTKEIIVNSADTHADHDFDHPEDGE